MVLEITIQELIKFNSFIFSFFLVQKNRADKIVPVCGFVLQGFYVVDDVKLQIFQFYSGFKVIEVNVEDKYVFYVHVIVKYDPIGTVDV